MKKTVCFALFLALFAFLAASQVTTVPQGSGGSAIAPPLYVSGSLVGVGCSPALTFTICTPANNGFRLTDSSDSLIKAQILSDGVHNGQFLFYDAAQTSTINIYGGSGGSITVNGLKSTTGTRYVCADTTGKLVAQTTACSGT